MILSFLTKHVRQRQEALDARVADAEQRAADATAEAAVSVHRERVIRENVVEPLNYRAQHNQFAQLIRDSLTAK